MNRKRILLFAALASLPAPRAAFAADSASLQFTVPAPNPVPAGDRISFQALAINTGARAWTAGSYYWVVEIYDLEYRFVARTEQVSPPEAVSPGGVASISIGFRVPETMVGRQLYRVFLVKDTRGLMESEYIPFEVLEKPIPPSPESVDYRVEGNATVSYQNSSRNKGSGHSGATTINMVGKLKESSYLFNAYILHEVGDMFDPFIILGTYYAPWGTIYAGDLSPTVSQLSVDGQGLRGGMLEQRRGRYEWAVLGGQTVTSQAGSKTTNGRFARTLYALKLSSTFRNTMKLTGNYFLSSDEPGSLSSDRNSPNFRGDTLVPEKNSGQGLAYSWEPVRRLQFLADYQQTTYFKDTAKTGKADAAWKGEFRWEKKLAKVKAYVQRAGTEFVAFGAPGVVGDRMTFNGSVSVYPASWYTLSLAGNQYTDNLKNDPAFVTTTQRVMSTGHALQFKTGTSANLSASINSAVGKPKSALDNQTTTAGLGLSQSFGKHSGSLSASMSQFKDKNALADDLDTTTLSLSSTFALSRARSVSFGASQSQTKNKKDGSARQTLSVSPSFSRRIRSNLVGQIWGTVSKTKNTSLKFPADTQTLSGNSEMTWTKSKQLNLTLGLGYNKHQDKIKTKESFNEVTLSTRLSYSF